MIKAIELKVGNKFLSPFGKIETVLSIIDNTDNGKIKVLTKEELDSGKIGYASQAHMEQYSHLILCEENGNQYKPCEISGIKLTDKLFQEMGFERVEIGSGAVVRQCWQNFSFNITILDNGDFFYDWMGGNIQVKYAHHLQNIYFALHQKELLLSKIKNHD